MRKPPKVGSLVSLEQIEAEHIRRVLAVCPTFADAAVILGIEESTLWRKRRKWKLDK